MIAAYVAAAAIPVAGFIGGCVAGPLGVVIMELAVSIAAVAGAV